MITYNKISKAILATFVFAASCDVTAQELISQPDTALVQVAFRQVAKRDLTNGVESYNMAELMKKDYATASLEVATSMISGFGGGSLWGQSPLVLVDGVPRTDGTDVLANEVESVSFLKSAAAVALYGSRGANGVVLITTKRGKEGERVINIQANTGIYVPKRYPKYLSSWEYMTLYNEALANDGLDPLYSDATIQNYYTKGGTPRYPDNDFYSSDYIRSFYNHHDVTAEISGGNKKAHFYTNIGLRYENSLLNFGEGKNENNLRFNARGNVDYKFNDFMTATVDASAILITNRYANGNYWGQAATVRPNRYSPLVPISALDPTESTLPTIIGSANIIDGQYVLGGTQQDQTNPWADVIASGYNRSTTRQFALTLGLDFDLSKVLEGLTFKTRYSIDYSSGYTESRSNTYATYEPTWWNDGEKDVLTSLTQYGEDRNNGAQNVGGSWYRQTMNFSAQLDWQRSFANRHNLSATLLAQGYQTQYSGEYHRTSNANLGLNIAYNYDHRYYAEMSSALVHSAMVAPSKRNAFSPTLSLAWRLKGERWMKDVDWVDDLKVSASAGILHTDLTFSDYYLYQGYYTQTNGAWISWRDGASLTQTTDGRRTDNDNLGMSKRKELTAAIDGTFFDGLLSAHVGYFYYRLSDMPTQRYTIYPSWFTSYWPETSLLPYENYNENRYSGVEMSINLHKKIGEVDVKLGFNANTLKSEVIAVDENYADSYQYRTGKSTTAIWGLVATGLFHCQEDIDRYNATSSFDDVKPGDIMYVDKNADGIIDTKDEVCLGSWMADFFYGINLTAKWKNFTLFVRGTGSSGGSGFKSSSYYWMSGASKYSEEALNRWTFETAHTATYPRLSSLGNSHNFRNSTFWLYSTRRFDLDKVQLTYELPKSTFEGKWVKGVSLWLSGSNLLTISGERKLMETNVGSTPQCRYYSLGAKIDF